MKNDGTHNLTPIIIGTYAITNPYSWMIDYNINVILPTDGVTYSLGYFGDLVYVRGHMFTQVRSYYEDSPSEYTYWNYGSAWTLPDTINQSVTLTNPFKKSGAVSSWKDVEDPETFEYPVKSNKQPLH
jgi:hypothetical protein